MNKSNFKSIANGIVTLTLSAFLIFACSDGNDGNNSAENEESTAEIQNSSLNLRSGSHTKTIAPTARFAILKDKLYAASGDGVQIFDLASKEKPVSIEYSALSENIESIFADGEHLYVGANTTLDVYSVDEPTKPKILRSFGHKGSCDPIIKNGSKSFVPLRSLESACSHNESIMVVYDLNDPKKPEKISKFPVSQPRALAMMNNRLFVCDTLNGIKEFSVKDKKVLKQVSNIKDAICFTIHPAGETLVTTGPSGISQFDISDNKLSRISNIEFHK